MSVQEVQADCGCWGCIEGRGQIVNHMVLCPECGNKRCPRATSHDLECQNSNEPGQPGSAYEFGSGAATDRRLGGPEVVEGPTRYEVRVAVDWDTVSFGVPEPEDIWIDARNILTRVLDHGLSKKPLHPQSIGEVATPHLAPAIDVQKLETMITILRSSDDEDQHDIADSIDEALGLDRARMRYDPDLLDQSTPPSRAGLEAHQVWAWMGGANPPHWEVRGTGAIVENPRVQP